MTDIQAFALDPLRYDIALALGIIHFNNTGDIEKVSVAICNSR